MFSSYTFSLNKLLRVADGKCLFSRNMVYDSLAYLVEIHNNNINNNLHNRLIWQSGVGFFSLQQHSHLISRFLFNFHKQHLGTHATSIFHSLLL